MFLRSKTLRVFLAMQVLIPLLSGAGYAQDRTPPEPRGKKDQIVTREISREQAKADSLAQRRIELDLLAAQAEDTSEVEAVPGLTPEERKAVREVFRQVHPEKTAPAAEERGR